MQISKADLSDVTFVIPFCLDTPARLTNLEILLDFLMIRLDTNVIISELDQGPKLKLDVMRSEFRGRVRHSFHVNHGRFFSRSRSVNLGAREVETPYLAINDADALVQTCQYLDAVTLLREGVCDMALPYANRVMWIPQDDVVKLQRGLSDDRLGGLDHELSDDGYIFFGLVGLLKTDAFRNVGMMNERFRSWGFEEMELYMRLLKLGFRVLRTSGPAYHLGHPDGGNSSSQHPHFLDNRREYHKVLSLNPADLHQYVSSWPWAATMRD